MTPDAILPDPIPAPTVTRTEVIAPEAAEALQKPPALPDDAEHDRGAGYPGLVVHGPLQALLMGECLRRSGAAIVGHRFTYRLLAPTFGTQRLGVTSRPEGTGLTAQVRDGAGIRTASATLQPVDPHEPLSSPS